MTVSILPPLPVAPNSIARPGTFAPEADAFFGALPAFRDAYNANVPGIQAIADLAPLVASAANYKGPWASLAGALAIPASVTHAGKAWLLSEDVANVAAHEPGVSSKWVLMTAPQNVELISTTTAAAVASVEWTNFEALAGTYAALRLVADGIVGSAATADLKGDLRQNGAWITDGSSLNFYCSNMGGSLGGAGLCATGALKNVAAQAITLEMDITGLGRTARPNVRFGSMGGTHSAGDTASYGMYGWITSAKAWTPTTPPQGLRIFASTGNLSGTFRLYGVRK